VPHAEIGEVRDGGKLEIFGTGADRLLAADVARLKSVWQKPLDW
jgi:hypothetical protein